VLPIEFTVEGPPVSYRARQRSRLRAWEDKVARAARTRLPANLSPLKRGRIKITVVYFHETPTVRIDTDNLVKPVQDALTGLVYTDDVLVTDTIVRKQNLDGSLRVELTPVLAAALQRGDEFLYVLVELETSSETVR
jgi:crossover junction endodeoxyribonuclease RusA